MRFDDAAGAVIKNCFALNFICEILLLKRIFRKRKSLFPFELKFLAIIK